VDRAARETLAVVDHLFPEAVGEPAGEEPPERPRSQRQAITARSAGYVQAIDEDAIFAVADDASTTIWMDVHIGDFVFPGSVLASVWPANQVDDDGAALVRDAFILGSERTLGSDVAFGVRQIADIALRALSPGINDPTTAANCVDRLAEILVRLGNRSRPPRTRASEDRQIRFVTEAVTYESVVDLALTQLRHYGASDPIFAAHLMQTLGRVLALVPASCRPVLARHARELLTTVNARLDHDADRHRIRELADQLPGVTVRAMDGVGTYDRGPLRSGTGDGPIQRQ